MFELPFYICELPLGKLSLSELAFGEQWVASWLSLLVVQYPLKLRVSLYRENYGLDTQTSTWEDIACLLIWNQQKGARPLIWLCLMKGQST